jgi:hypothetical protein
MPCNACPPPMMPVVVSIRDLATRGAE